MSSIVNKVKDAVSGDKHSTPEGTHGHHNNRAANAADPRIDSDRDNRAAHNTTLGGTTGTTGTTGLTGTTGTTTGTTGAYTHGPASTTDGPHKSNLMNKADPRVDSDRDHSRNMGANPHGTATTGSSGLGSSTHGTSTLGSSTHGTTTTHSSGLPEGTTGPHGSRMANAADPRVDSDLDSSRNRGIGGTTTAGGLGSSTHGTTGTTGGLHSSTGTTGGLHGTTGTHNTRSSGLPEGTTGPHSSRAANAADPRVDSDLDSSRNRGIGGNTHSTTHGTTGGLTSGTNTTGLSHGTTATGPAPNTAGPHKSDMMNKMDPRVDSDLDGSKTTGGNKTFSQSETLKHKDPTDAAQVPPSVLQKHIGAPQLEHDHHDHEREKRHSISHQEQHRGL